MTAPGSGYLRAGDGPAFDEPWQAEALAIAQALQDAGVITPAEWAEALGRERARPGLAADGGDYYVSVVAALTGLLAARQIAATDEVATLAEAWRRAAHATPHGQPVRLENDPRHRAAIGPRG